MNSSDTPTANGDSSEGHRAQEHHEQEQRLEAAVHQLLSGFRAPQSNVPAPNEGDQTDDQVDDQAALRWRHALLRLSETFLDAAEERRDLSPILLGALHNALEQLLIHGNEQDLMSLEEWLGHEAPPPKPIESAVTEAARAAVSETERRLSQDRRSGDRRRSDRRAGLRRRTGESND